MIKFVLDDYRGRFFTAFISTIQVIIIYSVWIFLYMAIVTKTDIIKYSIGILPMLTGFFLSRMYPNQIHKLMFLCPMSDRDRKRYMITAYGVRVGISIAVYILLSMPAFITDYISTSELLIAALLVLIYVMGTNMHHPLLSMQIAETKEKADYGFRILYTLLSAVSQIAACLAMVFLASADKQASAAGIYAESAAHSLRRDVVILLLTELLLNTVICLVCYKPVMKYGMNYELCGVYSKKTK